MSLGQGAWVSPVVAGEGSHPCLRADINIVIPCYWRPLNEAFPTSSFTLSLPWVILGFGELSWCVLVRCVFNPKTVMGISQRLGAG